MGSSASFLTRKESRKADKSKQIYKRLDNLFVLPSVLNNLVAEYARPISFRFSSQWLMQRHTQPLHLTHDDQNLFVSCSSSISRSLRIYDLEGKVVNDLEANFIQTTRGALFTDYCDPSLIEIVDEFLYIVHESTLLIVNHKTNTLSTQWPLPDRTWALQFKVDHDRIYFSLNDKHQICACTLEGREIVRYDMGEHCSPFGLAVDQHTLYVSDYHNHCIKVLDKTNGEFIHQWGKLGNEPGELYYPAFLLFSEELLYVSDKCHVQVFSKRGDFIQCIGTGRLGSGEGEFDAPMGLCILKNKLYIADSANYRVQVFTRV